MAVFFSLTVALASNSVARCSTEEDANVQLGHPGSPMGEANWMRFDSRCSLLADG